LPDSAEANLREFVERWQPSPRNDGRAKFCEWAVLVGKTLDATEPDKVCDAANAGALDELTKARDELARARCPRVRRGRLWTWVLILAGLVAWLNLG